jgi:hypothetical protein
MSYSGHDITKIHLTSCVIAQPPFHFSMIPTYRVTSLTRWSWLMIPRRVPVDTWLGVLCHWLPLNAAPQHQPLSTSAHSLPSLHRQEWLICRIHYWHQGWSSWFHPHISLGNLCRWLQMSRWWGAEDNAASLLKYGSGHYSSMPDARVPEWLLFHHFFWTHHSHSCRTKSSSILILYVPIRLPLQLIEVKHDFSTSLFSCASESSHSLFPENFIHVIGLRFLREYLISKRSISKHTQTFR